MADLKFIVSTRALREALNLALLSVPGEVAFKPGELSKEPYLTIGKWVLGPAMQPFEEFTVARDRADRLARVMVQLQEQPITLVWDGENFSFTHFVI